MFVKNDINKLEKQECLTIEIRTIQIPSHKVYKRFKSNQLKSNMFFKTKRKLCLSFFLILF